MKIDLEEILMREFKKSFGEEISYSLKLTKHDVPTWDSLNYISFMVNLEKITGTRFSSELISSFVDLNDILIYLKRKSTNI